MKLFMKTIRNFIVANLCALVPLWVVVFGWMPDQVKVYMRQSTAEPVSIVVNGSAMLGEDYGTWAEGRIWRFYLREGMAWKDLEFRLPEGLDGGDVGWVRLEKWKLLSLEKSGTGLKQKDAMSNAFCFPNPRFERLGGAQGKIPLGLSGVEFLLLGCSWWFARGHREEHWKTLWPSVLGMAFVFALLFQVALPIQSYVANRSAFPFMPGELGGAIVVRFAVALALGGLALGLLARCFGRWVLAPVLAFAACAYLESGVLSIGLPSLNGNWTFFENATRAFWNSMVWIAVFTAVCGSLGVLKKHFALAAFCLSLLVGASLLDTRAYPKTDTSDWIIDECSSQGVVARSVVYAPTNNILVFVIDSLECPQAHAVMEDVEVGARLREQFRGFTEYTNNIGTGDYSDVAVANLLTGKYPESAMEIRKYYDSVFSENSLLKEYLDRNDAIFFIEDRSYTNRRDPRFSETKRPTVWECPLQEGMGLSLESIDRFRWCPFGLKLRYLRLAGLGLSTHGDMKREWDLYPILGKGAIAANEECMFLFAHTEGVHLPVQYNRNGEQLPNDDDTDVGCVEMGVFLLGQLGNLMDVYREKGIFDNATIVVLADHGHHEYAGSFHEVGDGSLPSSARPFLWVKVPHSQHEFKTSSLPTSHSKISALLKEAGVRNITESDLQTILKAERRLFRKIYVFDCKKEDWVVGSDGVVEKHSMGSMDMPTVNGDEAVKLGHLYSLTFANRGEFMGIIHSSLSGRWLNWRSQNASVKLSFKVPELKGRYAVRIGFSLWYSESEEGRIILFHQEGHDDDMLKWTRGARKLEESEICLYGVTPNEEGRITIIGERGSGCQSVVDFTYLQVDKVP